jgi:hypothetical protein
MSMNMDPITLPDPMDESNNVGRNCFRFSHVQRLFLETYEVLAATPPASSTDDYLWLMRQLCPSLAAELPRVPPPWSGPPTAPSPPASPGKTL